MRIGKKAGNLLRSAAIAYFLAAAVIIAVLLATVFRGEYFISCFSKSEYYTGAYTAVTKDIAEIENKTLAAVAATEKVDESTSIMAANVDRKMIYDDVNAFVRGCFSGEKYTVDTEKLTDGFYSSACNFAEDSGVKLTENQRAVLKQAANAAAKRYGYYVEIPALEAYTAIFERLATPLKITLAVLVLAAVGLGVVQFILNDWPHRALRYVIYGITAAGLIVFMAPMAFYLLSADSYSGFTSNRLIASVLTSYIDGALGYMILVGIVLVALSVVLTAFVYCKMVKEADW